MGCTLKMTFRQSRTKRGTSDYKTVCEKITVFRTATYNFCIPMSAVFIYKPNSRAISSANMMVVVEHTLQFIYTYRSLKGIVLVYTTSSHHSYSCWYVLDHQTDFYHPLYIELFISHYKHRRSSLAKQQPQSYHHSHQNINYNPT